MPIGSRKTSTLHRNVLSRQQRGRAFALPQDRKRCPKVFSYFLLTAFFSSTPGVNLATRRAAILMTPPVCGLRPLRALRCEVEKVPKPTRVTRSPFFSAAVTASTIVSIAPPAAVLLMPCAPAILSTRSPLFMLAPNQVTTCKNVSRKFTCELRRVSRETAKKRISHGPGSPAPEKCVATEVNQQAVIKGFQQVLHRFDPTRKGIAIRRIR